jgi:hypothetical protein
MKKVKFSITHFKRGDTTLVDFVERSLMMNDVDFDWNTKAGYIEFDVDKFSDSEQLKIYKMFKAVQEVKWEKIMKTFLSERTNNKKK